MVSRLLSSKLVQGVHFCTLNLEKSVRVILENLQWQSQSLSNRRHSSPLSRHNQLIEDDTLAPQGIRNVSNGDSSPSKQLNGLSISPSEASQLAQWGLTHHVQPPTPKKTQGATEESWDEYPNGRFTDVRSPAYGEIDGYGSGLKISVSECSRVLVCFAEISRHKLCATGGHPRTPRIFRNFSLLTSALILPHPLPHSAIYLSRPNQPLS
jgi:methylenetetrahydrofolate reductase (NADPH)